MWEYKISKVSWREYGKNCCDETFRINGTKKLELDIAGNVTASGDIVLQGTAPSIRIQDTRQLNNPDWDSVSLGNIEFYSSDTTSPGARVLSGIC